MQIRPTILLQETTIDWSREIVSIAGRVFAAYAFDANKVVTEGLAQPSYEATPLYVSSVRGKSNEYIQNLFATDGLSALPKKFIPCIDVRGAADSYVYEGDSVDVAGQAAYPAALAQAFADLVAERPLKVPAELTSRRSSTPAQQFDMFDRARSGPR